MTRVQVVRRGEQIAALRVKDHAGYADSGYDIVCAAASVLTFTCANALESVAGVLPHVTQQPAYIEIALPEVLSPAQAHDAQVILRTALQGFEDIAAQYPKYLQII